jgi:hypothetical protein
VAAQRPPTGPTSANLAFVAAIVAVVVLAVVVSVPLPDLTHLMASPSPVARAPTAETPEARPAPSPRSTSLAPVLSLPPRNPLATPFPSAAPVGVDAGPVQIHPAGSIALELEVTLAAGWAKASDAMYVVATRDADDGLSISAWRLEGVFVYPCRWASGEFVDPELMRTLEGQAEALSAWWGQDATKVANGNSALAPLATEPEQTSFHGHRAVRVEVLIPQGLDLTQCDGDLLVLWEGANGELRASRPGELHWLFVVDVDGELIVIDAASFATTSVVERAKLQAVLDSIVIAP